jgi:hypothetical protein
MKKTAALALTALLLAATGCSTTQGIDHEKIYLELVHSNTSNTSTDAELIRMAKSSCTVLREGGTLREIAMVVATADLNSTQQHEVSQIIGYGISQYCPEFSKQR